MSVSIFQFSNGYRAVGLEGQYKCFVPNDEVVNDLLNTTYKSEYRTYGSRTYIVDEFDPMMFSLR